MQAMVSMAGKLNILPYAVFPRSGKVWAALVWMRAWQPFLLKLIATVTRQQCVDPPKTALTCPRTVPEFY